MIWQFCMFIFMNFCPKTKYPNPPPNIQDMNNHPLNSIAISIRTYPKLCRANHNDKSVLNNKALEKGDYFNSYTSLNCRSYRSHTVILSGFLRSVMFLARSIVFSFAHIKLNCLALRISSLCLCLVCKYRSHSKKKEKNTTNTHNKLKNQGELILNP